MVQIFPWSIVYSDVLPPIATMINSTNINIAPQSGTLFILLSYLPLKSGGNSLSLSVEIVS